MSKMGSNQYRLENVQGQFQLLNRDGDSIGHVESVITESGTTYNLVGPDEVGNFLGMRHTQLFKADGSIRALGRPTTSEYEALTSPVRALCVRNKNNSEVFEVSARSVESAPERVMLTNSQGQSVYVSGHFAVTNFQNPDAIDAEFDRQVRVHQKGLDVNPADLRMTNFPVLGR